jgi:hypothetical protein
LFENCQCCLEPWLSEEQRENGENKYLCTDEPTPAPVTPIDDDGDAVTDLDPENIVEEHPAADMTVAARPIPLNGR